MNNKKYSYFVSYQRSKGYGNVEVFSDKKITSYEHVLEIQNNLMRKLKDSKVVIINWKLLYEATS